MDEREGFGYSEIDMSVQCTMLIMDVEDFRFVRREKSSNWIPSGGLAKERKQDKQ